MKWESYSHPISDIRDWSKNKRLELQPDFQRKEVWSNAAQIMLIDTILKDIPIPKVYIKSYIKEGDTYRVVIDGQQRMTAILKFLHNEYELKSPYIDPQYDGKCFRDLETDLQNDILRYKIDINEIFNPSDEEVRNLYARVNKYTVQLNKQELRRADYPGEFINISEELSISDFFEDAKIFTAAQRRRMLDVEYISELLSVLLEGVQDKKDRLDEFCEKYANIKNKETLINRFMLILKNLSLIFDEEDFPISKTRFKQKSDFYSLFACIDEFHRRGLTLDVTKIEDIRKFLDTLNKNIDPHADEEDYREYAVRCLSDANSMSSRNWRLNYLKDYLDVAYK